MKKVISYRGNRGIASNVDEAWELIESFFEPDVNYFLVVNEMCEKQLQDIFTNEDATIRKVYPLNSGSRGVKIENALGDTLEEHYEKLNATKQERALVNSINTKNERRTTNLDYNKRKDGIYLVHLTVLFLENGKSKRFHFVKEIRAHSILNAYNIATDQAVDYCDNNGYEFIMVKELISRYTNIEYLHE